MAKVKLTKNELKKQKESLSRFQRYLPTLQLKKQQLQAEIANISRKINDLQGQFDQFRQKLSSWVAVYSDNQVDIKKLVKLEKIRISEGNIGGVSVPELEEIKFGYADYDFYLTPVWVESGIVAFKQNLEFEIKLWLFHQQKNALAEELRITNQRVNLFEKVKIPNIKNNIKKIKVFLGDLFTAQVVRGKIAKNKLESKGGAQ
jgi:V/A-type H+-transporting ATPase subunit D